MRLFKPNDAVYCIKWSGPHFTVGNLYFVSDHQLLLTADTTSTFISERFELVSLGHGVMSGAVKVASLKVPEWRVWATATLAEGHCVCGIARAACKYHQ